MTNHLAMEKSRYLLQHASNPVDWYPWGDEALSKAREEDKPILLSIGYSACHWCHVMADESFVDAETAQLMNASFVNIKVDREERPDLDKVYQAAHQLLTGRGGGWPLTVFLSPKDRTPFFAGTYFPLHAALGMPTFKMVLHKVAEFYRTNPALIAEQNIRVTDALQQLVQANLAQINELSEQPLLKAREQLAVEYDAVHGGFGRAPKFPQATSIERLLRWWSQSKMEGKEDKAALAMVTSTLSAMAKGGIYDQIGGGFYRYTVDAAWQIPHFEKMLYDNGQLLGLYGLLAAIDHNPRWRKIVEETIVWLMCEMHAPGGGFYSTLDADSEHHEGKFYHWDKVRIKELLSVEEYAVAEVYFGLDQSPNFEGHWHLHVVLEPKEVAKKLSLSETEISQILNSIRQKLFKHREQRIRPGRDEKIITAWNGLVIKGLALSGQYLHREHDITIAQQTVDFIVDKLWKKQRLFAVYQHDNARFMGYLDDYALLLDGVLTLLQVKWRLSDLNFAISLADNLLSYFEDKENGGFFYTASDHEPLIQRPKALMDEALPVGNGIAALALARLGYLLGEDRYLVASKKTLCMAWSMIDNYPTAHPSLLNALEEYFHPPQIIVLRGSGDELLKWQQTCQRDYAPRRFVVAIPENEKNLPPELAIRKGHKNKVIAYLCIGHQCLAPIEDFAALEAVLAYSDAGKK